MGLLDHVEPAFVRSHGQLSLDLGTLLADKATTDFTFVLPDPKGGGEAEIGAHTLILRARSEYFQTVFGCGMAESVERRMHVPELTADVFERFLEYLYTGTVQLTPVVALHLYNAGDKFLMEDLKRLCLQFIWTLLDSTCIVELLCQANSIGMEPKFINLLLSYAAGHIGEISQEEFNRLTPELVISLLQCGSLSAREADILNLVCSWAKQIVERDLLLQSVLVVQAVWRRYRRAKATRARQGTPRNDGQKAPSVGTSSSPSVPDELFDEPSTPQNGFQARESPSAETPEDGFADDGPSRASSGPPNVHFALSCGEDEPDWGRLPQAIGSALATAFDAGGCPSEASADSGGDAGGCGSELRVLQRLRRRRLDMLRELLAQPLRYIRFSLVNQKDLARLAEKSKIRIITDAVTDGRYTSDLLSGGRRTASSVVQLTIILQKERTEKNFEYNGFKFKVVLVKSEAALGVYLHFQYYTYPQLFVINAQGIAISLVSVHSGSKKKTRTLDNKIGLGRYGLGYKAFVTAAEFPDYISAHNEARVEVDFPFYNGRKLRLCAPLGDDSFGASQAGALPPPGADPTRRYK
eukprot:EG_transcript_3533